MKQLFVTAVLLLALTSEATSRGGLPAHNPGSSAGACAELALSTATNVVLVGNTASPASSAVGSASVPLTSFKNTGKWYYETTLTHFGVNGDSVGLIALNGTAAQIQAGTNSAAVAMGGGIGAQRVATGVTLGVRTTGDVIGVAVDFVNWQVWFRVAPSGNWNANPSANPATNTDGISIAGYADTVMGPVVSFNAGSFASSGALMFNCSQLVGTAPAGFAAGWSPFGNSPADGGLTSFDPGTATNAVFDDGNLITQHSNTSVGGARALASSFRNTGLYYYEINILAAGSNSDTNGAVTASGTYADMLAGTNSVEMSVGGGAIFSNNVNSGVSLGAATSGTVVGIALDFGHQNAWLRYAPSGQWNANGSANPATDVGGISFSSFSATTLAPAIGYNTVQATVDVLNSGRSPFVGPVPSGFTSGWPK